MKNQLTYNESQLIFTILIKKMGYAKSELLSDSSGSVLNGLLKDDFVRHSICHHANEIKKDVVKKHNLKDVIKSLNTKFEYNVKEVI